MVRPQRAGPVSEPAGRPTLAWFFPGLVVWYGTLLALGIPFFNSPPSAVRLSETSEENEAAVPPHYRTHITPGYAIAYRLHDLFLPFS